MNAQKYQIPNLFANKRKLRSISKITEIQQINQKLMEIKKKSKAHQRVNKLTINNQVIVWD